MDFEGGAPGIFPQMWFLRLNLEDISNIIPYQLFFVLKLCSDTQCSTLFSVFIFILEKVIFFLQFKADKYLNVRLSCICIIKEQSE